MSVRIGIDGRFVCDRFPGIARYLFNLLLALPCALDDEEVVVLRDPDAETSRYSWDRIELEQVAAPVATLSVGERLRLPRMARRLGLDLMHSPYFFTASRWPCPWLVTVHDLIPLHHPEGLTSTAARLAYRWGIRRAVRRANAVIVPSQATAEDLHTSLDVERDRLAVTPYAVDPRFEPAPADAVERTRDRLGLPERYLLCLGTGKPHKNLARLVEAWALVRPEAKGDHRLVVAGRPDPRFADAVGRCRELGLDDVHVLGEIPEPLLPALYSGATAFVLPSLREGFGLPVLEAMACQVPVACSSASSLDEVAGDAALLFDANDAHAIAAAIRRLLTDSACRRRLVELGQRRVQTFTWQLTARLTVDAYRRCVEAG